MRPVFKLSCFLFSLFSEVPPFFYTHSLFLIACGWNLLMLKLVIWINFLVIGGYKIIRHQSLISLILRGWWILLRSLGHSHSIVVLVVLIWAAKIVHLKNIILWIKSLVLESINHKLRYKSIFHYTVILLANMDSIAYFLAANQLETNFKISGDTSICIRKDRVSLILMNYYALKYSIVHQTDYPKHSKYLWEEKKNQQI